MTHSELARRTGVDRATLVNAEAGRKQLSLTYALLLAREFGVHVEDLVELVDQPEDATRHRLAGAPA